jgi:hypothetical protein
LLASFPSIRYTNLIAEPIRRIATIYANSTHTVRLDTCIMTELTWEGKYKEGKKVGPVRIQLPFQTVETVNETAQQRQMMLD